MRSDKYFSAKQKIIYADYFLVYTQFCVRYIKIFISEKIYIFIVSLIFKIIFLEYIIQNIGKWLIILKNL